VPKERSKLVSRKVNPIIRKERKMSIGISTAQCPGRILSTENDSDMARTYVAALRLTVKRSEVSQTGRYL